MIPAQVDVLIVGAGFGGSLLAQILAKSGKQVALVERGSHPRFAMGESTSPLTNLLLEQFALEALVGPSPDKEPEAE